MKKKERLCPSLMQNIAESLSMEQSFVNKALSYAPELQVSHIEIDELINTFDLQKCNQNKSFDEDVKATESPAQIMEQQCVQNKVKSQKQLRCLIANDDPMQLYVIDIMF